MKSFILITIFLFTLPSLVMANISAEENKRVCDHLEYQAQEICIQYVCYEYTNVGICGPFDNEMNILFDTCYKQELRSSIEAHEADYRGEKLNCEDDYYRR